MKAKQGRMVELDMLRFVAASAVLLYHLEGKGPLIALRYGYIGVPLFFMISGFVILWTASGRSAVEFLVTRITRLYPSFWLCVGLTSLILTADGRPPSARLIAANLTMVPSAFGLPALESVYWTLTLEIKFYVLIFIVLMFGQMRRIEWVLGAWLAICVWDRPNAITLNGFGPLFIAGCLFFLIKEKGMTLVRATMLGICLVLSLRASISQHADFTYLTGIQPQIIVAALIVLIYLVLLAVALGWLRLSLSPIWYVLGSLTYPLYLLHYSLQILLAHKMAEFPTALRVTISLVTVFGLAAAIAAITERRICPIWQRAFLGTVQRWKARKIVADVQTP